MTSLRRTLLVVALVALSGLSAAALWSWPTTPVLSLQLPAIEGTADRWLAAGESRIEARSGINPNSDKRIRWQPGAAGERTELALVYLHGFSATRQEIAPVGEQLADLLGANLFETRLAGHGLRSHQLENVTAEDWLADTAEALAIGKRIGKRVILMGTSTGATLALAAANARPQEVAALILVSPNFSPRDTNADFMLWPGGPLLAQWLLGPRRSWQPSNALQAQYWTTEYPTQSLVEVMRLVKALRQSLPMDLEQPLLVFMSRNDDVISIERAFASLAMITAPAMEIVEVETQEPGHHVLAGDILAPQQTGPVAQKAYAFLQQALGKVSTSTL